MQFSPPEDGETVNLPQVKFQMLKNQNIRASKTLYQRAHCCKGPLLTSLAPASDNVFLPFRAHSFLYSTFVNKKTGNYMLNEGCTTQ
jgi:hypothetical protein